MESRSTQLFLVPTPIGNLKDVTLRALEVLQSCDEIYCEDTRTSSVFLKHYEISKPLHSFHAFNEHKTINTIVQKLKEGKRIAYISDAGTPGISDPGFLISRACHAENIPYECLPGATALIPALVNSGFPSDRFVFEGFLPVKKGRQTKFKQIAAEERTCIIYESPHRIEKTIEQLQAYVDENRKIAIVREISKKFEETLVGTCAELLEKIKNNPLKGEIVLVIKSTES